ncbi:endonuclease/exonuclease/phosphatase family protein [Parendozoicomonas sp. Alg238-R29]|uniref:endonuclease/exonuclease/phosphatase family protein n=1 Tax=Parendozoicomonas sp. Alg238-R29 TaxID=2993446 RepID=UPI00248EC995|nr:endonuclease/exonuclease/phosphatase family protein [Parendozoicomonas sp. Alg238-R29]
MDRTGQHSKGFATTLALVLALIPAGAATFSTLIPFLLGDNPPTYQQLPVQCSDTVPKLSPGQPIKVMSWNIQFLAGAYYPYWTPGFDQPLLKPEDIDRNLERIVEVIREENPDILQLQEVHRTHPLTHHRDQLAMLYEKLSDFLPCYSSASYWKARFIPSKYLTGNVDMAMVTMSRFHIKSASKQLLPATRRTRILVPFYPRHSLLETNFTLSQGGQFTTINTHLDCPSIGRGRMDEQIHALLKRITQLTEEGRLWMLSGDFNLTPPGFYPKLPDNQKSFYSEKSPLTPFYKNFHGIPQLKDIHGAEGKRWLTAYDLNRDYLDLLIDYIFHPHYINSGDDRVRHLPLDISDHMPVFTTLYLSPTEISPDTDN